MLWEECKYMQILNEMTFESNDHNYENENSWSIEISANQASSYTFSKSRNERNDRKGPLYIL